MNTKVKMKFNVLAVFAIIIFCVAISPVTLQNDTFYTVKIGEHILEKGIDMQDSFSWHEDLPYTYPHWLYDVGMYLIYNTFGWTGIYVSTIILAAILGISIYFTNTKITKNNIVSFILTLRSIIFSKRLYSSTCTTCNIYIICTYYIFYRTVFTNKEEKVCNRVNNYSNFNS